MNLLANVVVVIEELNLFLTCCFIYFNPMARCKNVYANVVNDSI